MAQKEREYKVTIAKDFHNFNLLIGKLHESPIEEEKISQQDKLVTKYHKDKRVRAARKQYRINLRYMSEKEAWEVANATFNSVKHELGLL